jgi:hypothetical protein
MNGVAGNKFSRCWAFTSPIDAGDGLSQALSTLVIGLPRAQNFVEEMASTASAAKRIQPRGGISRFKVIHLFSWNSVCYA